MKTTTPKITCKADALNSYRVTDEQLSKCELIQRGSDGKYFVLAESMSEPGTIYRVEYNPEFKVLQCLPHTGTPCKAQEAGNGCWHKRAALATFALFRLEQRQARLNEQARVEATEEYAQEQQELTAIQAVIDEAEAALAVAESDTREARAFSHEADSHEARAVKRYGARAYEHEEIRRDGQGRILR